MILQIFLSLSLILVTVNAVPLTESERFISVYDDRGNLQVVDLWEESKDSVRFDPEQDIRYLLFTRENPKEYQIIKKGDNESLWQSNFNVSNGLKLTIAGWQSDYLSLSNVLPRDAYLAVADVNVVTVDWEVGSQVGYLQAVRNTLAAGPIVAEFIDWIHDMGISYTDMHLMGNSLGAQMCGLVGRHSKGIVNYITAMDPANPNWGPNSERIRKTDAKYVELIHSNSGIMGMRDAAGHNDFYPNKGVHMPGCDDVLCSHELARHYFAESIVSGGFTSIQCMSVEEALAGVENCTGTAEMKLGGIDIKPEVGIFALNTNDAPPYSME